MQNPSQRVGRILDAAHTLLSERSFHEISAQEIARRAGVAKGTLFLHYGTKETLGLAVLRVMLRDWWSELGERFSAMDRPASSITVAASFRRSLEGRTAMLNLMAALGPTLERNATEAAVHDFRVELVDAARHLGLLLEEVFPHFRRGEGAEMILTAHATMIGVRQLVNEELPAGDGSAFRAFRVDVAGAVGRTMRVQLEGVKAVAALASTPTPS